MEKIKTLHDRVAVKRDAPEEITKGGIVLPGGGDQSDIGVVVSAGPGKRLEDGKLRKMSVKDGDRVVIPNGGGEEVVIGGETLVVVFETDIIGVIR